jgi:hypothetical protein
VIKVVLLSLWLCIVTLGAAYGVMTWKAKSAADASHSAAAPVVLQQFVFTVETEKLAQLSTKPDIVMVDEAFKLIYTGEAIDFRTLRKNDIMALAKLIMANVNKRLGQPVIHEVLVQEFNYLPKDQLRGNG